MRERVVPVIRLTRFQEYVWFVLITTLLGAAAAHGRLDGRLILVLAANWLAVGFAFMINDVEDAADDALNPAKIGRNPVSAGHLSPTLARALSFAVAVLAAGLYASLGPGPFLTGLVCLVLAYLYSARGVRLKVIPVADLVSHALMLAGLQFLAAYLAFSGGPAWQGLFPVGFVMAISLYGQLFNQLRDLEGDRAAGLTHTTSTLGERAAQALMMVWFAVGLIAAAGTVFVVRLIPTWVLGVMAVLALALVSRPLLKVRADQSVVEMQQPFQKPLEMAAAVALALWFAESWALGLLR